MQNTNTQEGNVKRVKTLCFNYKKLKTTFNKSRVKNNLPTGVFVKPQNRQNVTHPKETITVLAKRPRSDEAKGVQSQVLFLDGGIVWIGVLILRDPINQSLSNSAHTEMA